MLFFYGVLEELKPRFFVKVQHGGAFIDNANKNYSFDFAQLAYLDDWAKSKPILTYLSLPTNLGF